MFKSSKRTVVKPTTSTKSNSTKKTKTHQLTRRKQSSLSNRRGIDMTFGGIPSPSQARNAPVPAAAAVAAPQSSSFYPFQETKKKPSPQSKFNSPFNDDHEDSNLSFGGKPQQSRESNFTFGNNNKNNNTSQWNDPNTNNNRNNSNSNNNNNNTSFNNRDNRDNRSNFNNNRDFNKQDNRDFKGFTNDRTENNNYTTPQNNFNNNQNRFGTHSGGSGSSSGGFRNRDNNSSDFQDRDNGSGPGGGGLRSRDNNQQGSFRPPRDNHNNNSNSRDDKQHSPSHHRSRDTDPQHTNTQKTRVYNETGAYVQMNNFQFTNEEEQAQFKTKQQNLFERDPKNAQTSSWKSLREGANASGRYLTPNMPVPIVGEAIYGTHAVYSALVNQKRRLHHMYILASVSQEVKRSARPADFKDRDFIAGQKKNKNGDHNDNNDEEEEEDDSLFDSSFLLDSNSTSKLKSIVTNFGNHDDELALGDEFDNGMDGSNKRYLTPHHMESNRENLINIYELAQTLPNLKVIPLKREKLDLLSQGRPHNGVILDAAPLQPDKKDGLTPDDMFVPADLNPIVTTATVNLTPNELKKKLQQDAKRLASGKDGTATETTTTTTTTTTTLAPRQSTKPAVYLALESIFDPNNLGAILRSATWFGIDGLIIPHNSCPLSPAVAKVSCGALDFIPIIKCSNLDSFLDHSLINSQYQPHERSSFMKSLPGRFNKGSAGMQNNHDNNNTGLGRKFDKLCIVGLGLTNDVNCVSGSDIFDFINKNIVPTVTENMKTMSQNAAKKQRLEEGNGQENNNQNQQQEADPFAIVVVAGNEGFGLSPQIASKCHLMFKVPSYQQFPTSFNGLSIRPVVDSLNVSNAVAISMNDIMASRSRVM